ncbi:30S ribosomal protein S6 [Candidatus Gracilibacteria bacterium]|nr:30S ribosomal protein S6 [Candidatus Gracilibacteria bacterium]
MKKYELMFILNPELQEDDKNSLISEIKKELKQAGVKVTQEDDWGVKDLAYKIRNSSTGHYILYSIESDGKSFFDLTKLFNIKKDIWRHIFIKLED